MNFEELFNYCTKINESESDKCLICHIPIESEDTYIKLGCSHIYHKECIKYKSGKVKCLYCNKLSIPNLINYKSNNIYCKVLLKSGINKGKLCNRFECKYHTINNNLICKSLIKNGINIGNTCGRINCKYHK